MLLESLISDGWLLGVSQSLIDQTQSELVVLELQRSPMSGHSADLRYDVVTGRNRPTLLKNSDTPKLQNSFEFFRVPGAQSKVAFPTFERRLGEFSCVNAHTRD